MNSSPEINGNDFLASALASDSSVLSSNDIMPWFSDRQREYCFEIEQIPFDELKEWTFSKETGNLKHASGRFFSIEGIHVATNWGSLPTWEQPIINQPEIGFLGFIIKKFDGILHFLVQAKMEPGNINYIQLAPTLQATRSNFTRVHRGKSPRYLEYFTDRTNCRVVVDSLQSEQGARFLRKRNRNIIIEVWDEVQVYDDFCWLTLGQILQTMRQDNIINMDARTVLSCLSYDQGPFHTHLGKMSPFGRAILESFWSTGIAAFSNEDIISWFTEQKFRFEMEVTRIPLREVKNWVCTSHDIHHESGRFFSVIACAVKAASREVPSWTQPLVKAHQEGLIAFVVKPLNGVLHFLVQAKVEPGNFDVVEMAPTVQCLTGSYECVPHDLRPPFVNYLLEARPEQILYDTRQSEEGGRFFREANRNMIVMADSSFPESVPDNFIWMTAGQLKEFIKYNNFVNVQARCLMASLSFI